MAQQYIFQMQGLTKAYPGSKKVCENIWRSFLPDAKIGVVGPNGAGKYTLLKVMAGLEPINKRDAQLAKGATVGILMQEPPLTEGKTVLENIEEGVSEVKSMLRRFN